MPWFWLFEQRPFETEIALNGRTQMYNEYILNRETSLTE